MLIISRDMRGRIFGAVLFSLFLMFHLYHLAQGWSAFNAAAKANSLLITATIFLFLSSYFLRKKPVRFAEGIRETLFPLVCAALPLVIYHDAELLRYVFLPKKYYAIFHGIFGLFQNSLLSWNLLSMTLALAGNFITLAGMVSLRRSFSLMVEAREPVFTGLYAYVRHPLYIGEAIATAGVLVFRFSAANVFLFLLFLACQAFRAALEEKKLLSAFPEYRSYRRRTGAFLPRTLRPIPRRAQEKAPPERPSGP
ncbi:MAG TPA: isoprenylcysteine carboxylmethyltransferase family protein [Nitrospirota bacterium]